jgi:hypothetical protein
LNVIFVLLGSQKFGNSLSIALDKKIAGKKARTSFLSH